MCLKGERQQHVYATPERKSKFLEEVDEEMDRQDAEDRGRRGAETCAPPPLRRLGRRRGESKITKTTSAKYVGKNELAEGKGSS
jgi:hypothetical protein